MPPPPLLSPVRDIIRSTLTLSHSTLHASIPSPLGSQTTPSLLCTERWMSKDHQLRNSPHGQLLRAKEVRLQEKVMRPSMAKYVVYIFGKGTCFYFFKVRACPLTQQLISMFSIATRNQRLILYLHPSEASHVAHNSSNGSPAF